MTAILYGLGVGPGDPELMTLKAVRLIAEAQVVFCPKGSGRPSRARTAAAAHLEGKRVVELDLEMRGDRERALDAAAATVAAEIGSGPGVYLTEGDPSLFSTFHLLRAALARRPEAIEVVVVPGVSSILAAAAATGRPLGMGDQALAVLPASAPMPLVEDVLGSFDQTVLLKPSMGQGLPDLLERMGLRDGSALVVEASGQDQAVRWGTTAPTPAPYFSTWLVPGGPPPGAGGRVSFVGAGPGDAGHLTRRALRLLRWADLVVAADSLVAPEVLELVRPATTLLRSSKLTLEEALPPMLEAARAGRVVVRLHSGDPSIYGAVAEQMAALRRAGCAYEVVPGVSAAFAAAAALGVELTQPGGAQTVIFTRHGRQVPTPASERLADLAASRATMAIFLSASSAGEVQAELEAAGLDPRTPAAIAHRVAWPEEQVVRTTVGRLAAEMRRLGLLRHTLILVGEALGGPDGRSRLYDSGHAHVFRKRGQASRPELAVPPALVALTAPGLRLARRLARSLPGAEVLVSSHLAGDGETPLGEAAERVRGLFNARTPLILFMAVGAAVRLLAPALRDKRSEPPVVVVDDAGHHAVSLLGGRAAGANRLAEWVAAVLRAGAVVTTAAEQLGLPALDGALAARGWRLDGDRSLAAAEAGVVSGEPIGFFGPGLDLPEGFGFDRIEDLGGAEAYRAGLAVSDRVIGDLPAGWALARPRRLRLGLGCSTGATAGAALAAVASALDLAGLASKGVGEVATIDRRRGHPAVTAVAQWLGVAVVALPAAELERIAVPNGSETVREAVGTSSVAEAAALAAGATLVLPKQIAGEVTIAVAENPATNH